MNNLTKIRLGWKYRRQLWKYRGLIRHRRQIMGIAAAGAAIAVSLGFLEAPCDRSSRDNE